MAVSDDYLLKCGTGLPVTPAGWNDLQANGLNLSKVDGLRKYVVGWRVYGSAAPMGELTLAVSDNVIGSSLNSFDPLGVVVGGNYVITWRISKPRNITGFSYVKLYNQKCGG